MMDFLKMMNFGRLPMWLGVSVGVTLSFARNHPMLLRQSQREIDLREIDLRTIAIWRGPVSEYLPRGICIGKLGPSQGQIVAIMFLYIFPGAGMCSEALG